MEDLITLGPYLFGTNYPSRVPNKKLRIWIFCAFSSIELCGKYNSYLKLHESVEANPFR